MGVVRKTKAVQKLLDIFEKTDLAMSSVSLVKDLEDSMNKTTVYRILDRLESQGLLHSFQGFDGVKWYAKCQGCSKEHHNDRHPHFQCRDCGKTECLSADFNIPELSKHKVEYAQLLLTGQCADCAQL
ncbi:Fur family transcriptional regulator [Gilvibacter sp.]|uniref:Fur family transcriptional regulator n=1 Tax=Gilvibacter sp. TaxID=2729997 RepID=UPI003F49FB2E